MRNPMLRIAQKELRGIFTERTILLAVVVQVFVAGFSGFLVVGLSALVDPGAVPAGADVSLATWNVDDDLRDRLAENGIRVQRYRDAGLALTAFDQGHVDGVLLGNGTGSVPVSMRLILPEGDFKVTFTLTGVKSALEAYERDLRLSHESRLQSEPLYVDSDAKSGSFAFVYGLLIPLLVFLPVVLAGALTADSVTEEVQRGTLPLLLVTPATPADVVEGKLLANVAMAPLLASAWFLLLGVNGLTVPFTGAVLILVLATAASAILGVLACVIAFLTKDRNKAHVTYATGMMLVMAVSMLMPVSPVNAVARLAAGSAGVESVIVVGAVVAAAVAAWVALHYSLKRVAGWMSGAA